MTSATELAATHDAAGRHNEAIDALARAAQAGDGEAMTQLGKRLMSGERAPLLPEEGAGLLLDAARAGAPEAAARVAVLSALGAYTKQSWSRALELLVYAAERGWEPARGQLCVLAGRPPTYSTPGDGWGAVAEGVDPDAWRASPPGITLHEQPTVRRFAEFISDQACDWIMQRATGRLKRARIYDAAHGSDMTDRMRTNSATGFDLMDVDLVQIAIQHRMADAVGMPVQNMEGPTILHYEPGQQITPHFDFVNPEIPNYADEIERRGERVVTFLVYLNDDYADGETEFPHLGVRHKGRRREALFFTNALPSGEPDTQAAHAGRPPASGEKWVISQFIRNRIALNMRAEYIG